MHYKSANISEIPVLNWRSYNGQLIGIVSRLSISAINNDL